MNKTMRIYFLLYRVSLKLSFRRSIYIVLIIYEIHYGYNYLHIDTSTNNNMMLKIEKNNNNIMGLYFKNYSLNNIVLHIQYI